MAKAMAPNIQDQVPLDTTCNRITGYWPGRKLHLLEATVGVYVVTADVADGAALPSSGRQFFAAADMPLELDVTPYGQIALAGDAAGTCEAVFRTAPVGQ